MQSLDTGGDSLRQERQVPPEPGMPSMRWTGNRS